MKGVCVCGRGAVLQFTQLKPVYLALEMPYLHPNPTVTHMARAAGLLTAIFVHVTGFPYYT